MTRTASDRETLLRMAESMSACLKHRGPDDSGSWSEPDAGVALGFRRLAIIDLSPTGHQPMRSASERFTVVFNGEVYNYLELRDELARAGSRFRGQSDTEVILGAFERWGVEAAVKKFIGMFAMAVWDAQARRLFLMRDRLGIKPLYYFHRPGLLTFASELKALAAGPDFDRTVDETALTAYLRYLYIPAPHTIYRRVRKLLPGHILRIDDVTLDLPESVPYWSLEDVYRAARASPIDASDAEVVAELRRLLADAVRLRLRSDVPMGALLSGGVDSSTVVALMQDQASQAIRTFTIGFPGTAHDEALHAAAIARALGTNHTEMAVSGDDALAVVPQLPDLFDEPFADPSQIPTYLVCKLARRDVTVAVSGDGGDEIFAGYERYIQGERLINSLRRMPRVVRQIAGAGVRSGSSQLWERAYRGVAPFIDRAGRHRLAGEKIRKVGNLLRERTDEGMYRSLLSAAWQDPADGFARASTATTRIEELLAAHPERALLDRMMLTDQQTYLADDLLAKVDRASMAVSLEARVPILDHRIVEFAWTLQRRHKVRNGRGKWALRQVLYSLVDPQVVDRPKTGFTVPIAEWLRGPLRAWGEDLLFHSGKDTDEWLSVHGVRKLWLGLQNGAHENALAAWATLMFQAWRQRWLT